MFYDGPMRIFVAGASGAIGLPLVRRLSGAGHEVTGSTRGQAAASRIREAGGEAVLCDVFDRERFAEVMERARPEVVINQLTSLPAKFEPRKRGFYDANNRIRSEGGDNLIEATARSGAGRLITQSIAFLYEPGGPTVKAEEAPVDRSGVHNAVLHHERQTLGDDRFDAVVLRYGMLYGPGTWYSRTGYFGGQARARRLPVVGDGNGLTSFLHVEDAASAAAAVLKQGTGIYNVTDDEPARMSDWVPAFAAAVNARPPRRVPFWLASLIVGKPAALYATRGCAASNARIREEIGWSPSITSWRDGFMTSI